MVLLHIASIKNNPFDGVCVVVPKHVVSQSHFAEVGFINVNNVKIDGISNQLPYDLERFDINNLAFPFNKPDLVVFHEVYVKEFIGIYKNLIANGIKYVILPHAELTAGALKKKRLKKLAANILFFNRFINSASGIQCLAQNELDTTRCSTYKFIGTNGIDVAPMVKNHFNTNRLIITYIGRLDAYHKGLDLLIEAARFVKDDLKKANCVINIYGPDVKGRFKNVQNLIRQNNVEDLINLYHEVTGVEKAKILLNSDIFIQTSRFEGMPLGILEACSFGLPCLVTEGTMIGSFVNSFHCGWVVNTDSKDIGLGLLKVINERNLFVEKSKKAVEMINHCFKWQVISEKTVEHYWKIVNNAVHN